LEKKGGGRAGRYCFDLNQSRAGLVALETNMTSRRAAPTPAIRRCPLCGIAMQAGKSREDLKHFDTFQCLSCHTTIVEAEQPSARRGRAK
jgi:hypothetical protein